MPRNLGKPTAELFTRLGPAMSADRRFAKIPRRQRNTTRGIARDGLLRFRNGDGTFRWGDAEPWVESQIRQAVGSIWVTIAIALAIALIRWWLENRVTEPSSIYELGEPGNYEAENAN
jgi:hypothetical protein